MLCSYNNIISMTHIKHQNKKVENFKNVEYSQVTKPNSKPTE